MTALQWIVKEAKSIKKKYPKRFSKWTEYVAQASAIYASKHKGKSPVGKKKVSGYVATKRKGKTTNVIYTKKKLGALPIGFKGSIWGVKFKIVNQFDIYGDVSAIVENIDTGHRIVTFDGKGSANEKADVFAGYVARHGTEGSTSDSDMKALKSRLLKFVTNMQKEVKDYNAGKKKTIKKQPLNIPVPKVKKIAHKKSATKKAVKKEHTHWGKVHAHERRVNGVRKKKISEQSILNRIHKVKDDVSKLDELQHKHMIGKRIKIGSLPTYKDKDAAREIQLFADNDYMLYQQRKRPILINLGKKYKKGTYDVHKAAKLWRYYIDAAMQKYHKEFGTRGKWSNLLSVPDRNLLALDYAMETKNEFDLGNFTI